MNYWQAITKQCTILVCLTLVCLPPLHLIHLLCLVEYQCVLGADVEVCLSVMQVSLDPHMSLKGTQVSSSPKQASALAASPAKPLLPGAPASSSRLMRNSSSLRSKGGDANFPGLAGLVGTGPDTLAGASAGVKVGLMSLLGLNCVPWAEEETTSETAKLVHQMATDDNNSDD